MRYVLIDDNGETVAHCATMAKVFEFIDRQKRFEPSYAVWLKMPNGKVERPRTYPFAHMCFWLSWPQSDECQMDHKRDLRATRRWFAAREAGWTPAERVRRAAFYACEPWAE